MVRAIRVRIPAETVRADLERYREYAMAIGSTDAVIVPASMVVTDCRVQAKCRYPKCAHYGTSVNCPPYAMDASETRTLIAEFEHAILVRVVMPTEACAGNRSDSSLRRYRHDRLTLARIVSQVESQAFYDGYYLAVGFACGSCKSMFCANIDCAALVTGQPCRHPLRARAAMEAVGIDAYRLAAEVGWEIYPIGMRPSHAPYACWLGLILIC